MEIVKSTTTNEEQKVNPVLSSENLFAYQNLVRNVPVADNVIEYTVKFTENTRPTMSSNKITKIYCPNGHKEKEVSANNSNSEFCEECEEPMLKKYELPYINT